MATLSYTFALLFFLFTFPGPRFQVHSSENDITMLVADSDPTLLLPTEKSADESASPEIEAIDINDLGHVNLPEPTTTIVSFHPINRHFRTNRYPRRRPCPHFGRPMKDRSRDISYGNDMILPNENKFISNYALARDKLKRPFQSESKFISNYALARDKMKRPPRDHSESISNYALARDKMKRPPRDHSELISNYALARDKLKRPPRDHSKFISNYALARDKLKRPFGHQSEFISNYALARDRLKRPLRREEGERENEGGENGGFVKRFRKFLNHF